MQRCKYCESQVDLEDPRSIFLRANALYYSGEYEKALEYYDNIVFAFENNPQFWINKGYAHLRENQEELAYNLLKMHLISVSPMMTTG